MLRRVVLSSDDITQAKVKIVSMCSDCFLAGRLFYGGAASFCNIRIWFYCVIYVILRYSDVNSEYRR